jgi:hypothetical protein
MNRQRDSSSLSLAHKSELRADHRPSALCKLDSPAKANSRNPDPVMPEQASLRPGCGYSEKTRNSAISSAADKKNANNPAISRRHRVLSRFRPAFASIRPGRLTS